jgi:alkaline phosphatase D
MKLAVASCSKLQQVHPQPVWLEIQQEQPDALLLLGDNIYLDHDQHSDPARLASELRRLYDAQLAEPNFAALLANLKARAAPVIAIYDDHDFLGNNRYGGDHDPVLALAARNEFIKTFAPPMTGADVYHVRQIAPVDIVVLDERFYRRSPSASQSDRDAILGAAQWVWFEGVVASSTARYLVVASSTTAHKIGDESWEQYPAAFDRLRRLVGGKRGAMLVSGDVHQNIVYDDSGIVEIVTSAVARRGLVFGALRKNYGILTFAQEDVHVELRSLKVGCRFDFSIPLSKWQLP